MLNLFVRNSVAVIEKKEDNVLTIEGVFVPHKKEHLLIKRDSDACPLCSTGLDVKHTVSFDKIVYVNSCQSKLHIFRCYSYFYIQILIYMLLLHRMFLS